MINQFLKAKHWQLFSALFGIPFLLLVYRIISAATQVDASVTVRQMPHDDLLITIPILLTLLLGLLFGWFWSIAIGLQPKIPAHINMKVTRFKILFSIPVFYISFLMVGILSFFMGWSDTFFGDEEWVVLILFPLHFLSMFCIFFVFYFVAKTIKTVELQKATNFGDFAPEFLMLWFYVVGIWIIQPRVNRLVADKNTNSSLDTLSKV